MNDPSNEYQPWPCWCKSPDGEKRIFDSEAEVPAGWEHHGEIKKGKAAPAPAPVSTPLSPPVSPPVSTPKAPADGDDDNAGKKDAAGTTFDPARHTGTLTTAGLWRMKVGVKRPEGEQLADL